MALAQCPKCENPLIHVNLEAVSFKAHGACWNGVTWYCPICHCALGVGPDPIALQSGIVSEVLNGLSKR